MVQLTDMSEELWMFDDDTMDICGKRCSICKQMLPLHCYNRHSGKTAGVQPACARCRSKQYHSSRGRNVSCKMNR